MLRSKLSGSYFQDFGAWTSNPTGTRAFTNEWSARDFIRRERVEDVQVVEEEEQPNGPSRMSKVDAAAA